MTLKAPKGSVDQIGGAVDYTFPAGSFSGVLEEVREREIPTNAEGEPFAGWVSTDGSVLGLQFGQMEPLDIDADPGDRKFFVDITVRDGELALDDVDLEERGCPTWQLQRSARTVLNLFSATGHAVEDEEGFVVVPDDALAELEAGKLNGLSIGLVIGNRKESLAKYKQRLMADPKAERRIFDFVQTFFAL